MTFQASASEQGKRFDADCRWRLAREGWDGSDRPVRLRDVGVEIDMIGTKDGRVVYFEFKGSWLKNRPGLRRTDTTKKALATGFLLQAAANSTPYVVITSHLPAVNSDGETMVRLAKQCGAVAAVLCLYDLGFAEQLDRATLTP